MVAITYPIQVAIYAMSFAFISGAAHAASDVAEFDDIIAAKISREKARKAYTNSESISNYKATSAEINHSLWQFGGCGSINIGNVADRQRFGGLRNLTVIVDAPVISTQNQCR